MTILTKPVSDKKPDKLVLPLVNEEREPSAPTDDVESARADPSVMVLRARATRVFSTTFLCLLLVAVIVAGIGSLAGTYLYRQYLRAQIYKGWAKIPYETFDSKNALGFSQDLDEDESIQREMNDFDNDLNERLDKLIKDFFNEDFELDLKNENYEKIDVPDFRNGRSGRFVHDFNTSKTGIIDVSGRRCFVMPLNKDNILPPRSLFDLLQKMWEGYYKVDTQVVRETMRVVLPPITDTKEIGNYIANECKGLPIYKLEKYVGGVVKRSIQPEDNEAKFAQYAGRIVEYNIMGLDEVKEYEKTHSH